MKKRHLIITIAALIILCLSGCHKDKPVESQAPLETIVPETQDETISDKLDETAAPLELHGVALAPDGSVVSEAELDQILESMEADEQSSASSENTNQASENSESNTNGDVNSSENQEGVNTSETTALSEEDLAEDRNDITPEEYQKLQDEIDDWTNKEADEHIKVKLD